MVILEDLIILNFSRGKKKKKVGFCFLCFEKLWVPAEVFHVESSLWQNAYSDHAQETQEVIIEALQWLYNLC